MTMRRRGRRARCGLLYLPNLLSGCGSGITDQRISLEPSVTQWKRLVDTGKLLRRQADRRRTEIVCDPLRFGRFRDHDDIGLPQTPGEGYLSSTDAAFSADLHQYGVLGKLPLAERSVGNRLNAVSALPGQLTVLDPTSIEPVGNFIGLCSCPYPAPPLRFPPLQQIIDIEIADTDVSNQLALQQLVESAERFGECVRAAPVEQVKVDIFTIQPFQRCFAGLFRAGVRGIFRVHLADDEQL